MHTIGFLNLPSPIFEALFFSCTGDYGAVTLYLLDVQDKFPEVNIVEAYFLVLEGKYIIELIGEKFLKAEIPLDLYKSIENNFAERLAAEEENQFMIDAKWANEFLKK